MGPHSPSNSPRNVNEKIEYSTTVESVASELYGGRSEWPLPPIPNVDSSDNISQEPPILSEIEPAPALPTLSSLVAATSTLSSPASPGSGSPGNGITKENSPCANSNGKDFIRPSLPQRRSTTETRYTDMLLSQDKIPRLHSIGAHFFTWLMLAGYLVFPATFTQLGDEISNAGTVVQNDGQLGQDAATAANDVLNMVNNLPFLFIAAIACGVGLLGMTWLWWRNRRNYIWLINRIFLPGFTNALAGLISTFVNIYTSENGNYSITAKSTVIVAGACALGLATLFLIYYYWALSRVKAQHRKETKQAACKDEESEIDMLKTIVRTTTKKVHADTALFDRSSDIC